MAEALAAVTQTQPAPAGRPGTYLGSAPAGRRSRGDRLALLAATACGGLAVAMAYLLSGLKLDAGESAAAPVVVGSTAAPTTTSPDVTASTAAETPGPTASTPVDTPAPTPADAGGPTLVAAPAVTPRGTPVSGIGGTAWMSCPDRATVVIESTAPNPGYTLVEARFGPAKDVKAVFVSGPRRTEIRGKCEAGELQPQVVER